jgi:hypothetical protein
MNGSEQTRNTLIWTLISAVICGLISFVQFDLVYYLPGAVFGFLFSIINFTKPLRMAIFVVASSIIFIIAWNIFFLVGDTQLSIPSRVLGGFLAGLFGALALALLTKVLAGIPIKVQEEARTAVVGALTGILFIEVIARGMALMFKGFEAAAITWPLAFAVWQVSVGWSLSTSIQNQPTPQIVHLESPLT